MRIGIFTETYYPYISGVVTSISMLEKGLKTLGHEVFIFTINLEDKEIIKKDNILYFKGTKIRLSALSNYRLAFRLRKKVKTIKEYNLDLIHIHSEFSMGKLGLLCSKKLNIPMVYTFHTLYEEYLNYVSSFLDRHFHNFLMYNVRKLIKPITINAKITIVPTAKVVNHINKYGIKSNFEIIPTGIDLEKFKEMDLDHNKYLKNKLGIDNEFIFMNIGRISEEKSLDRIISAFSKVARDINAKLIFVGNGPYFNKLKQEIEDLSLQDKVILTGEIDWVDIHRYYKAASVIVNASVSETQGLTNIEALASGVPLLVQKDESIEKLVYNEYNGFIFDGVDDLTDKMLYCYNNKEKLTTLENNCYKSVEKYSNLCYANNVLDLYKKVL